MSIMTPDERAVVDHLAHAWNAFLRLPKQHPDDVPEFRRLIHAAQEKIMARPAAREMRREGIQDSPHRSTLDLIGGAGSGYDHPAHNAMRTMLGDEA